MNDRSEQIEKLAEALAAAQGEIEGAAKDKENPHFKSRYADLASIWDAARAPLSGHGLAVTQTTRTVDGACVLVTTLMHVSGQWIAGELPLGCDHRNPQAVGSYLTYARRYGLAAMVGVCPEDDDGHGAAPAQGQGQRRQEPRPQATAETWSQYIGSRIRRANTSWLREMTAEGVPSDQRQEYRELTNEPRVVNHLCSRLIELQRLEAASIGKDKDPTVRDPAKARDAIRGYFEDSPGAIKKGVEKYLASKLNEARAQLGMPDFDEAGAAPANADEAMAEALSN